MKKADFPIFKNNSDLVYLDSAATSQKPASVIEAVKSYYENDNANVHRGIYELSERATEKYEAARSKVAGFIGAEADELVFTAGVTSALNQVAQGFAPTYLTRDGSETILLTEMEHHSNLVPWQRIAKQFNCRLEYVPVTKSYRLNYKEMHKILKQQNVKIVALTHMSNTLGTINSLEEIVPVIRKLSAQAIIVVDGAQAAPHLPVNVKELDVDFYAIAGHKMLGPTGIGALYAKKYLLEKMEPLLTGGGMISKVERETTQWAEAPHKFEAGTPNIAGAIVLAAAATYLQDLGYEKIQQHEAEIITYALEKFKQTEKVTLFGPDDTKNRGAVFSFEIEGIHAHDVAQILDEEGVAVRAGHHCNQILMRDVLNTPSTARASFYIYNEKEDVDKLFAAIEVVKQKFN